MLAEGHDGRAVIGCTFGSGLPGVWQPLADPLGMPVCDPSPWVANAKPFVVKSASQFRTAGPTAARKCCLGGRVPGGPGDRLADQRYSAARSDSRRGVLADQPGGELQRDRSQVRRPVLAGRERQCAPVRNAGSDCGGRADQHLERQVPLELLAADYGDPAPDDGNPATVSDASWTPLFSAGFPTSPPLPDHPPLPIGGVGGPLSTPPYPEHLSGATAYASASMAALASFFGTDNMTFYATSGRFPGEQRTFNRFSDLTDEVLEARIWAGIHFRPADVQAANLGREVERYIQKHQFAFGHRKKGG